MRGIKAFYLKHKNIVDFTAPFIYLFVLLLSVRYVTNAVNNPSFNITEEKKEQEPEKIEEKELDITLEIYDQNSKLLKSVETSNYKNTKSIADYLSKLRRDGDIYYERVSYINRIDLVKVLDLSDEEALKWVVIAGGQDITNEIDNLTFVELNNIKKIEIKRVNK